MIENRWRDEEAKKLVAAAGRDAADRELALRVYTSRLIGADHDLVMHGGGNTSCKLIRKDIFGDDIGVLHVKGSGWDLETIEAAGLPAVAIEPLKALRALEKLSDEDMVNAQRRNLLDSTSPNPSVETLLHAYLPHKYVDHTHATAMLALANLPDVERTVYEIFGDRVVVVPFIMPGFELAKAAADIYDQNPNVEGLLLKQHGHFAFAHSAKASYDLIIEHTNLVETWLKKKSGKVPKKPGKPSLRMLEKAPELLPVLRGLIARANMNYHPGTDHAMPVMDLRTGENVQEFLRRKDLGELSERGVATPDHVIRTKNNPLLLTKKILDSGTAKIAEALDEYVASYCAYFEKNAARFGVGEKTSLAPTPNLAWIEGVGVVGMGVNAKAASVAGDLAEQGMLAMSNGEACGGFYPVGENEIFDMEYWSLEQAKLGKGTPPKFQGKIVLITGAGGAIGLATAKTFAALGANIFLVERDKKLLASALTELGQWHGGLAIDITKKGAANEAISACVKKFGGLDILVSNAGAAWSGELTELSDVQLRESFELNFFAHEAFAKAAAKVFDTQNQGGQILFNISKQAVNPGKGFGAYGIPKAATFFLLKQLALELGPKNIRVNGINADRIRSGLLDDKFIDERSKARGMNAATYMAGNLLKKEVEAFHVADAFVMLATSARTTAHVLTVDGGNIEAALR